MIARLIKDFRTVFLGQNAQSFVRFLLHVYVAKTLGPRAYGHYVLLMTIISYARVTNLGLVDGLIRQIPYYKGSGEGDRLLSVKGLAFWLSLVFPSIFVLFGFLGLKVLFDQGIIETTSYHMSAWFLMLPIIILNSFYQYFPGSAVAEKRFSASVGYRNALVITALILAIPGGHHYGLVGVMSSWLLAYATVIVIGLIRETIPKFDFNTKELKGLLAISVPLMFVSLIDGIYTNIDKFMIGKYLGAQRVGFYGVAVLMISYLAILPALMAGVLYPDMSTRFGKNDSPKDLYNLWWQPISSVAVPAAMVLPLMYFGIEFLILNFMPQFVEGVGAAQIIVVGIYFKMMLPFSGWGMVAIGRQTRWLQLIFVNIVVAVTLNLVAIKQGLGINGVAGATAITFVVLFFSSAILMMRYMEVATEDIIKNIKFLLLSYVIAISAILFFDSSFVEKLLGTHYIIMQMFLCGCIVVVLLLIYRPYWEKIKYVLNLIKKGRNAE